LAQAQSSNCCSCTDPGKPATSISMARHSRFLPLCFLAMAALVVLNVPVGFVGGSVYKPSSSSLRSNAAKRALPTGVEEMVATSVTTSLQVSTWGWYANVVCIAVPIIFLITLYLNSEKTKLRDGVEPGNYI